MAMDWGPVFEEGLSYATSLPYRIGTRQLFYHAMDRFNLGKDSWPNFKAALANWRRNFKGGWEPSTLCDTVRSTYYHGFGPVTEEEYVRRLLSSSMPRGIWLSDDVDFYVEVWVESEAMSGQFGHYLGNPYGVTLRPFRGDYSLPAKWEAAEHIKAMAELGKDVTILYFGDCDNKGRLIPLSALRDIQEWSGVPFRFEVGGLTVEQATRFSLPENFERPGQWQWEALKDDQARQIITEVFNRHVRVAELTEIITKSGEKLAQWREHAEAVLAHGGLQGRPSSNEVLK